MARRRRQSDSHNPDNSVFASQDLEETFASAACEQCRIRKVRCDRRIPQCSNCEKAGVPCNFPNREKRVNHVKKLVEDVSGLASRLDGIDQTMNKVIQHLSVLQSTHSRSATIPSSRLSMGLKPESPLVPDAEDMESIFYAKSPAEAKGNSPKSPNIQPRDHIATRLLFDDSRRTLGMLLERLKYSPATCGVFHAAKASAVEFELRIKYELYPQFPQSNLPLSAGDGQLVALPPRSILETCISDFFEYVNPTTPLFSESHLRETMDIYYAKACKLDEAYNLCFNNIIILALGLRSRLGRFDRTKKDGMSHDLLPAFLSNSFRALQHLSVFMQPRLICCQALATLVRPILFLYNQPGTLLKKGVRPWWLESTMKARCLI
ncbi:hypothetical protein N7510_011064 [Penicillium lagena]|uniref:uncharacterized protein n=1 Tax=Penicillium lagena TaxID=94218 RepID=UPI002540B4EF|nr:uncharacterized protein N7510_011064 [Penicillium lagena]KAJ5601530.1 hypothetical protein N7510_011064 [Penicillium lagena]